MTASPVNELFVDTNILVYAYDRSAGQKHTTAANLIKMCWENGNGCISVQVLQEFYVTVTRKIANLLEVQTARRIIADLAQWRMHIPDANDLLQAIDFQQSFQLSFWDATIVLSAARLGCKRLITEDLNHGQTYGAVRITNPFKENVSHNTISRPS